MRDRGSKRAILDTAHKLVDTRSAALRNDCRYRGPGLDCETANRAEGTWETPATAWMNTPLASMPLCAMPRSPRGTSSPRDPVGPTGHDCIDPLARGNLAQILTPRARKKYSVLYAPRQTGKTSILPALQDRLNAEGDCRCLYGNVEGGQAAGEDTARALRTLLEKLGTRARLVPKDSFVDQSRSA